MLILNNIFLLFKPSYKLLKYTNKGSTNLEGRHSYWPGNIYWFFFFCPCLHIMNTHVCTDTRDLNTKPVWALSIHATYVSCLTGLCNISYDKRCHRIKYWMQFSVQNFLIRYFKEYKIHVNNESKCVILLSYQFWINIMYTVKIEFKMKLKWNR